MDNQEKKQILKRHNKKALYQTALLAVMVGVFVLVLCGGLLVIFRVYSISFDLGDGSEILTENYTVGAGKISLGTPQRDGYRFTGWTGSNGSDPKINVTVGEGQLGNLSYVANWSDELNVTCEDWIVDAEGNLIENITDKVDKFLKDGNSGKGYKVVDRTIKVKAGTKLNPSKWGDDKSYKAYEANFMYVGNSGDVTVNKDGLVVYRYFNPVFDVNYVVDGESASKLEIKDLDLAKFNLYVDNELVSEKVSDYCGAVPYGSTYRVEPCWVGLEYACIDEEGITGVMGNDRCNIDISFATREEGSVQVSCQDWVVDKDGNRLLEITDQVDEYLAGGSSSKGYSLKERTAGFNAGDVVSGALWGDDMSPRAYVGDYCYAGCSEEEVVGSKGITVYRYFYPLLDIGAMVNGEKQGNTAKAASFNLYVDDELVAENVTDFYEGVPSGSSYRVEIVAYIDYSLDCSDHYYDHGVMGNYSRKVYVRFEDRVVK